MLPGLTASGGRAVHAPAIAAATPLAVASYGPRGRTQGGATIFVRFNQPVVSLEKVGDERTDIGITLDPPIVGRAYFQSPELLVFEPKDKLPVAHRFIARLRGPIESLTGSRYEAPLQWEMETGRPRVSGWDVRDTEDSEAPRTAPVFLSIDEGATAEALQPLLTATARPLAAAQGPARPAQPVAVRIARPTKEDLKAAGYYDESEAAQGRLFIIRPRGLWPEASEIKLTLRKGLVTAAGPLPIDLDFSTRFHTVSPLRLVSSSCTPSAPCGLVPIAVRFNNRIPEKQAAKLRIIPKPEHFEATLLDRWGSEGRELSLSGMFLPGTTYHVQVPADLTDKFGYRLGKPLTLTAVIARRPTMELSERSGTLRVSQRQTVGVVTRHIRTLRVRGAVLDDTTAVALLRDHTTWDSDGNAETPPAPKPWPTAALQQFERTVALEPKGLSDWHELTLDLAELSGKARRAVLIEVQAAELVSAAAGQPIPPPVRGLYRLTDLGPVGVDSQPQSVLAVMRLSTGQPVAGARLSLHRQGQPAQALGSTDASGILVVHGTPALGQAKPSESSAMLVAEETELDDHAYLPWPARSEDRDRAQDSAQTAAAERLRPGERPFTHIVSERDAYLPGERVRVVGWSAIDTPYQRSGLRRPRAGTPVEIDLTDDRGRVVATHKVGLTAEGKFWAELPLPEPGTLGQHTVTARVLGARATKDVRVEDFRVPEFSVDASVSLPDVLPGQKTQVRATASYFFGGPMRILAASYYQRCEPTHYRPPALPNDWSVGAPIRDYHSSGGGPSENVPGGGLGRISFALAPPVDGEENTRSCAVSVSLSDASFQSHGAHTGYLAHAARYYLAVQNPPQRLVEGDTASLPVRALAVAGTRVAAAGVSVSVVWRHSEPIYKVVDGKKVYDKSEERRDAVRSCTLDLPQSGPDPTCTFPVVHVGSYEVTVRGRDEADTRHARTEMTLWVQEKPRYSPPPPRPPAADLELRASSEQVKPGETLQLSLRAPWLQSYGVVVLARNGVREHHAFQLHEGAAELKLSVDDTWFPAVHMEAFLVCRGSDGQPRIRRARTEVSLTQEHRRLQVTVTAPTDATPGTALPIAVRVRDAEGRPSRARVALWAVDEAVLSLTNYTVPDLLPSFVPTQWSRISHHDDYRSLLKPFTPSGGDPWFQEGTYGHSSGHLSGRSASSPSVQMGMASVRGQKSRNRFETTPLFLADLEVGPDGVVQATAQLPDNLTTFRVTAVASARLVDGDSPGRFGMGDARVRVSTPLIVRAALPRLLRPGDSAELGALVNNLGGPRGHVQVTVRLLDDRGEPASLQMVSPAVAERNVEVGDQLRIPFQILAVRPSKSPTVVEVAATLTPTTAGAPVLRDAMQLPLPVELEPTLRERVAAYGDLASDAAVALPVQIPDPAQVRRESGGLTITASTSLLGGVAEAAAELVTYPYGCIEQTASRLMPLVALRDVLNTYPLPISDGDIARYLDAGVQRMLSMQTSSGGFAYWPGGREPNVYASAYATWVLQLLRQAGYPVPRAELDRAADYLFSLVEPPARKPKSPATAAKPGQEDASDPSAQDDSAQDESSSPLLGDDFVDGARRAMAVQALAELGRPTPHAIATLFARRSELPLFARALLAMAMQAQSASGQAADPRLAVLLDELLGNVSELAGSAHINERLAYSLETLFHSETRTDAMVLLALLRARPTEPIVVKLARGLLGRRGSSGWRNTQETAYAVLALAEFARSYEREVPQLTTRAWLPGLSEEPQWEARFAGRSFAAQTVQLPMAKLLPALAAPAGTSAPAAAPPGLILQRTGQGRLYYRVGLEWSPAAAELPARAQGLRVERQLRTARGAVTAPVPIAAPVAVDLILENRTLMHYVVVNIPLPAGLEVVQRHLGRGQLAATLSGEYSREVSHEEDRRDRALLFFDTLQPGTHRHTVHLRTTTPGRFTLPPAQAEAMYTPELYGRSTSSQLTVSSALP